MKTRWAIVLSLVAFTMGAVISWSWRSRMADRDVVKVFASQEVQMANLCTGTLGVLASNDADKARRVLHRRLEMAIDNLYRLPDEATQFGAGLPNLNQALTKSVAYLQESNSRYAAWAAEIMERGQ